MKKSKKLILPEKKEAQMPLDPETGMPMFAKKESEVEVSPLLLYQTQKFIPPLYYWETVENDKSVLMTMAYRYRGFNYGMSYPIEEQNVVRINILRKKLFQIVKESLDVMFHHGLQILNNRGNIAPEKLLELEAIRFNYDEHWRQKVAAFNKLCKIIPITKEKAKELKFL